MINADWFIATASSPPLYNEILSLPATDKQLEERLEVDVTDNILTAPGIRVARAGFNNSGVSNHNRVVERHTSRYGAYWRSYDFAGSAGNQNIFTHPLAFAHDGGEIIFNLPNGLQGYYLVDGNGFRLDEAPVSIVSNPAASDPTVRNGLSCIGCHIEGMKEVDDQVRTVIQETANPAYNKNHALRLYVEDNMMDTLVMTDTVRYQRALQLTGGDITDIEPVSRFHEAFHRTIDATHASALVGMPTETFLERIRTDAGLQEVGLLALDSEGGSVKRDTWTESFQDIVGALDYPTPIGDTPVDTRPDIIPGRPVNVPDANLKALLLETLEVDRLTAGAMSKLTELNASDKGILDLTGLEFAINLEVLNISKNRQISDLSPIAGLTNLTHFTAWGGSEILDVSPLANLTKLTKVRMQHTNLSDISPLVRLTNLRVLHFYGIEISDISAIANMTKLEELQFRHANISDISPIASLVNLKEIDLHDNGEKHGSPLADISAFKNLSKLTHVDLSQNHISDISSLHRLTNITDLRLNENQISDVSPLAHLANLLWLRINDNNISDFTPLADFFVSNKKFLWHNNPAYPKQGKMIEAPWLWLYKPGDHMTTGLGFDRDYLAAISDGDVTEIKVATHGATEGESIGEIVWTKHRLPAKMEKDNIKTMLGDMSAHGVCYGNILIYSPKQQDTAIWLHIHQASKVWLNGKLIKSRDRIIDDAYRVEFIPVTLKQGKNVLLMVTNLHSNLYRNEMSGAVIGFAEGTEYAVNDPAVSHSLSRTSIHPGDEFALNIHASNVFDLSGWQFDIGFDLSMFDVMDVIEGDFLKSDGSTTFFRKGRMDNTAGKITGLIAGRLSEGGVSGNGSLVKVMLKAKAQGKTQLTLENLLFGSSSGENIPVDPIEITIDVKESLLIGDANRDGVVNILDLIIVAQRLGKRQPANSPTDINGDGIVNIFDLDARGTGDWGSRRTCG